MVIKNYNYNIESEDALYKVLSDRGINIQDIPHYINTTDDVINAPTLLDNIDLAVTRVYGAIQRKEKMLVVVDCDCDGYTSSALFINFFNKLYSEYKIDFIMHEGKQHGLKDIDPNLLRQYNIIICADSSSNDYSEHKWCHDFGIDVVILDHHSADLVSEYAIVVNNQLCNYPNKQLSGVGIVWQFCRYYVAQYETDKLDLPDKYLDLVATGLVGDMQSMLSIETKHLIWKGFKWVNIHNPFISGIIDKNNFSLNKSDYKSSIGLACSPMGAAFFITPFINAITRSGTIEEKNLIFKSMLTQYAFNVVPSTKRGHKEGDTETIVEQALRVCTNVKNRQTKAEESGMELLEKKIQEDNMLQNPTLIFLLEPEQIDRNIAGLCANRIANRYQRSCLVLTRINSINSETNQLENHYMGSGRGFSKKEPIDFKEYCRKTSIIDFAEGHSSAFGLSLNEKYIDEFKERINQMFEADAASELTYYVDYSFNEDREEGAIQKILTIADMNDFWGKDLDRALVSISFISTPDKFKAMAKNTLKFDLNNGISVIKFGGTTEEIETFSNRQVKIKAICKCNKNEWNGRISAQLIMQDYEINRVSYYF